MAGAYLLGSYRTSAGGAAFFQSGQAAIESTAGRTFYGTGAGPEAALKWVDSLPAGDRRPSLHSGIHNP
jgi:hypothetical protein